MEMILIIEVRPGRLILSYQLRVEIASPIPRNIDVDVAFFAF
jgi:hypothetical protein